MNTEFKVIDTGHLITGNQSRVVMYLASERTNMNFIRIGEMSLLPDEFAALKEKLEGKAE